MKGPAEADWPGALVQRQDPGQDPTSPRLAPFSCWKVGRMPLKSCSKEARTNS